MIKGKTMCKPIKSIIQRLVVAWYLWRRVSPPLQLILEYYTICPSRDDAWVAALAVREYPDQPHAQWIYTRQVSDLKARCKMLYHIVDLMEATEQLYNIEFGKALVMDLISTHLLLNEIEQVEQWSNILQVLQGHSDVSFFQFVGTGDTRTKE